MDGPPPYGDPKRFTDAETVADGGHVVIFYPTFAKVAHKLLDQGYEPVPVTPMSKRVPARGWTTLPIDEAQVDAWIKDYGHCGVGLRTGHLVAIDIDILNADDAHQAAETVIARLGPTILRVGRWPKRLLLYRTMAPFAKLKVGKVEVLAQGQQLVAFGVHPDTRRPYDWPMGDSPLDVPLHALPLVNETMVEAMLAELLPLAGPAPSGSRDKRRSKNNRGSQDLTRDADGLVVDGRDNWLSIIAFHAVHDFVDRGLELDEHALAEMVWQRFVEGTDLSRPRQDGRTFYGPRDALHKVRDKLRLHQAAHLPARKQPVVMLANVPSALPVDQARVELDRLLAEGMDAVETWHRDGGLEAAPRIGLRATVGLGKSTAARRHVAALIGRLANAGLPNRLLNLVPSLALADETAAAWRRLGVDAVVLRGYEALSAVAREPMCLDTAAVRAAADARLDIQSSVCFRSKSQHCRHFASCGKQVNRRAVSEAKVVVAAYDAMFTGFAGDSQDLALIIVDEACWQRSIQKTEGLTVEALPLLGITSVVGARRQDALGGGHADVIAVRQKLSAALVCLPAGEIKADMLRSAGLDTTLCRDARDGEYAVLPTAHLTPGQGPQDRKEAMDRSIRRSLALQVIELWTALGDLLADQAAAVAKVWLGVPQAKDGQRAIRIYQRRRLPVELACLPLLHLDATLRADLASAVLPGVRVVSVDADAPHQHVRLIRGSFGKGSICLDPRAAAAENQRRRNRLQECINYVRWHAQRHAPGRILVITYKAIEVAFSDISGVEVAHYNAVAGLDTWGDISALFLIGRPLPQSSDLTELTGVLFDQSVQGSYASCNAGIVLRNGRNSATQVIRHSDPAAELLRSAICDDEIIQALGRGRGINRTAHNPLEVHVMADVALPVVHERLQSWATACPDIFQRMLLLGLAVSSPKHATQLHPSMFADETLAKKSFSRGGFKGHFLVGNIYREMSLKSASYSLGGRGQGWETAWWISGTDGHARLRLEQAVGKVKGWKVL